MSPNIFATPTFAHSHKKEDNRSANIKILICVVTALNHLIKEFYGFMDSSSL